MKSTLGIDPGLVHCGYAQLVDGNVFTEGVAKFDDIQEFARWLKQTLHDYEHNADVIGVEDWTYRGPGGKGDSSITVPKMIGVVMGIGMALDIPVIVLPTDTWKFALTGVKRSTDTQIQGWVEQQLRYKFKTYKTQKERDKHFHAVEAAGIAIVAERRK